jgi:molecular chaperone DnaK (HSP70)
MWKSIDQGQQISWKVRAYGNSSCAARSSGNDSDIDIDDNGILKLTAVEKSGGKKNKVITFDKGRLSEGEIEWIVKDEEYYRAEDEK